MACSRFEYVKKYELPDLALPGTFMVIRIDGRGFTKFSDLHEFKKPNDLDALKVMNTAAEEVCKSFEEIMLAYGQSDEYSFAFTAESNIFERRREKIVSTVVSMFTACYVMNFEKITGKSLKSIPTFDCRLVCYPSLKVLADYFSWRQADCHINNLYNTCFWVLVQKGNMSRKDAEKRLSKTLADEKNELLFSQFGINYSQEEAVFRKGTVIRRIWEADEEKMKKYEQIKEKEPERKIDPPRKKQKIIQTNEDIISKKFWEQFEKNEEFDEPMPTNK